MRVRRDVAVGAAVLNAHKTELQPLQVTQPNIDELERSGVRLQPGEDRTPHGNGPALGPHEVHAEAGERSVADFE